MGQVSTNSEKIYDFFYKHVFKGISLPSVPFFPIFFIEWAQNE